MPFVTEEVYQRLPGRDAESVMTSAFPVFNEAELDEESETNMATIMGVVDVVRNIRGETGIAPNVKIGVVIRANGQQQLLKAYEFYMKELARIKDILFLDGNAPEHSAVGVYKGIEVFVPIEGLIDVQKELGRIEKELVKIHEDSEKISAKLNNPAFREKAPPEVIAKNEASFNELQEKREKLAASKKMLESITG